MWTILHETAGMSRLICNRLPNGQGIFNSKLSLILLKESLLTGLTVL